MGVDAWLKWLAGIAAVLVGVPILLLYGLYWYGAGLLADELPRASRTYSDSDRSLYWRAHGGRGDPAIDSLSPIDVAWTISRQARTDDRRLAQDRAFAVLAEAARVTSPGSGPTRGIDHNLAEVALLIRYSRELTAGEVIDVILDRSYFGQGVHGLDAAAQRNFGRPAAALDAAETLSLFAVLKSPSAFAPQCRPERFRARYASMAVRAGLPATPQAITRVMQGLRPIACR